MNQGYSRASTNRIAERAGVSVGTLYRYFDNKEDIFGELLDQIQSKILQCIIECPPKPTLRELLETYNRRMLQIFNDDHELIQSLERLLSGPFQTQRNEWREIIIDAFETLIKPHADEITGKNLNLASRVVVCASEGLGSGANSVEFQQEGVLPHLLRLQLAYLTSNL